MLGDLDELLARKNKPRSLLFIFSQYCQLLAPSNSSWHIFIQDESIIIVIKSAKMGGRREFVQV